MLTRLSAVTDLVRGRHLLLTLLKLFSYCVKIGANRKALLQPHLNAISIMLASLNMVRVPTPPQMNQFYKGLDPSMQIMCIFVPSSGAAR